ncbi:MAG: hypothetical protein AAGG81_04890 [Chlamydiota bacterium]
MSSEEGNTADATRDRPGRDLADARKLWREHHPVEEFFVEDLRRGYRVVPDDPNNRDGTKERSTEEVANEVESDLFEDGDDSDELKHEILKGLAHMKQRRKEMHDIRLLAHKALEALLREQEQVNATMEDDNRVTERLEEIASERTAAARAKAAEARAKAIKDRRSSTRTRQTRKREVSSTFDNEVPTSVDDAHENGLRSNGTGESLTNGCERVDCRTRNGATAGGCETGEARGFNGTENIRNGVDVQCIEEDEQEEDGEDGEEAENDDEDDGDAVVEKEEDDDESEVEVEEIEDDEKEVENESRNSEDKAESPEGCATVADEEENEEKNQKDFHVTDAKIESVESPVSSIQFVSVEQKLVHRERRKRWNAAGYAAS